MVTVWDIATGNQIERGLTSFRKSMNLSMNINNWRKLNKKRNLYIIELRYGKINQSLSLFRLFVIPACCFTRFNGKQCIFIAVDSQ